MSYLCSRVHEAGIAQVREATQACFLTVPTLVRVLVAVVGSVG